MSTPTASEFNRPSAKPSWFQRNKRWFLPTIIIGPITVLAAFIWLLFSTVMAVMKNSDAYKLTMQAVQADSTAIATTGLPMIQDGMVLGEVSTVNGDGSASLAFTVEGPDGLVKVKSYCTSSGENWILEEITITPSKK